MVGGAYPRSQRRSLLLLLLGAVALTFLWFYWPSGAVDALSLQAATDLKASLRAEDARQFRPAPEAFAFDPNTVAADQLQRLGLSAKQAASWLKFRGSRKDAFRKPEDITKLFVLSEEDKARLIPLAFVAERANKSKQGASFPFDPNTVSAVDLQRLGLSAKQAAAWLKFRGQRPRAFRTVEDIRKLFVLSDKDKDRLVALAIIPEQVGDAEAVVITAQEFYFDPNTISADSLQLLGFPKWQTQALLRYRGDRPNTFRRATDLRRVGALDSARVESLIPWVKLTPAPSTAPAAAPNAPAPTTYAYRPKAPLPPPASVDINTADTALWKSLPGIGSYRAKRIVRFRKALGGFISVAQIAATHGLPDSTFQAISPYLRFATPPQQLLINQASYEDLKRHPYINRNLANLIVKNREKAGPFRSPEDLKRLRLITEEKYAELVPYLSFE